MYTHCKVRVGGGCTESKKSSKCKKLYKKSYECHANKTVTIQKHTPHAAQLSKAIPMYSNGL